MNTSTLDINDKRVLHNITDLHGIITILLLAGIIAGCVYCLPTLIGMNTVKACQLAIRDADLISFINY